MVGCANLKCTSANNCSQYPNVSQPNLNEYDIMFHQEQPDFLDQSSQQYAMSENLNYDNNMIKGSFTNPIPNIDNPLDEFHSQTHPTESLATPLVEICDPPYQLVDESLNSHIIGTSPTCQMLNSDLGIGIDCGLMESVHQDSIKQVQPPEFMIDKHDCQAMTLVSNEQMSCPNISFLPMTSDIASINNNPMNNLVESQISEQNVVYKNIEIANYDSQPSNNSSELTKTAEQVHHLKLQVRSYQKRLAVLNHRHQRLKSKYCGHSNKSILLNSLKACRANFNPILYEIFERCIVSPKSPNGNRWSKEVNCFASSIYLISKEAYRYLKQTINLPSESILKRYIRQEGIREIDDDTD